MKKLTIISMIVNITVLFFTTTTNASASMIMYLDIPSIPDYEVIIADNTLAGVMTSWGKFTTDADESAVAGVIRYTGEIDSFVVSSTVGLSMPPL